MKVVRIIARLNVGGPARHVVWLTKELASGEFRSVLIAGSIPEGEDDMSYLAGEAGIEPIFISEMSRELSAKDAVSLFKVYRAIKREKPDVIHTHTAKAGTVGRAAAFLYRWLTWGTLIGRPRRVSIVHTFHGHVFHSYYGPAKTKIFTTIEKLLARFATDKIIVISPQQFEEIHHGFKVGRREQFEIVPLGIDLEPFENSLSERNAIRDELGISNDELLVGFVGRLTEIKNVSLFIKAVALYGQRKKPDEPKLRFVTIGDGHLRGKLEAEANKADSKGLIAFLGNRGDTTAIYSGLDIVALTSFNEGTPLSLIEGMAAGRAVISTAVGGVVDLLGKTTEDFGGFSVRERGIAVEEATSETYLNGLLYLAKNEKLRESLAAAGRDFVRQNYSVTRLFEEVKTLYRNLVN